MKITVTLDLDVDLVELDHRLGGYLRTTGRDPIEVIRERVARGLDRVLDNEVDPTRERPQPIRVEYVSVSEVLND